MCPLSASPPELFCCFSSCAVCLPFINPSDSFHGAPGLLYICFIRSASASQLARGPIRICALGSQQPNSNPTLTYSFLRKEVIQPHLPIRLPCYDFTPVIRPAFDGSFLAVRSPASGISDSHGVTGGVYKTRERIHRDILIRDY